MNYWIGVGGVVLAQLLISWGAMLAGTGNGSFIGLAAMLLAILGIPTTAFLNFIFIYESRKHPDRPRALRVVWISLIVPLLQCVLAILAKVYRI